MVPAMLAERFNQVLRPLLLLTLLGWFIWLLVSGLRQDQQAVGLGRSVAGNGIDPGVRVLIQNRDPGEPQRTYPKLVVQVLQAAEVVAPDDPLAKREMLRPGAILRIEPEIDGLVLSSRDWVSGGKDLRWNVSGVVVQPKLQFPAPEADKDGNPLLRDPRGFEAADRRAVFVVLPTVSAGGRPQGPYRGSLYASFVSSREVAAVNMLPIETYLEGVVPVEMSPDFPLEALKAQAIASRGYARAKALSPEVGKRPYDLLDGSDDQAYAGAGMSSAAVARAVFETRGVLPLIHDEPFPAFFHGSSGGFTAPVDTVFPGATSVHGRVALKAVMAAHPDPYTGPAVAVLGKGATHGLCVSEIPAEDIRKRLATALAPMGIQVGYINHIRVGRKDARSGRVETVLVHHTLAERPLEIPAHRFRMIVDPARIRSTLWTADPRKVEAADKRSFLWRFQTVGWGHGVGLSQLGAWEMARQGMSAKRILEFSYEGVELVQKW
jgi:peptidoglycan hydrolase-like amidase